MNRRTLLTSALPVGLGLLIGRDEVLVPLVAPKRSCPDSATRAQWVKDALAASEQSGKPLLVLPMETTPTLARLDWYRGSLFGTWLNHGTDDTLARVAEVELVGASTDELAVALARPFGDQLQGDPLFWFVEDGEARAYDVPKAPSFGHVFDLRQRHEALLDWQLATLDTMFRHAVEGQSSRDRRAASARARLSAHDVAVLDAFLASGGAGDAPSQPLVDRGAAILAAGVKGQLPEPIIKVLATAARTRFVQSRIPGTVWGNKGGGCGGSIYEGVEPEPKRFMLSCGMGFVPERSKRFLRFYTCES
jgi:hypothetical protein